MSAGRPPFALAATVAAEAHVASLGAEPQPGLPEALPGWGEVPQQVFSPLEFPPHLRAAEGPVLVVDGVFDGERVFVREERDAGLRLGHVVEHAAVSNALTVHGDGPRGKIGDETLAVALVQAAGSPATTATVVGATGAMDEREMRKGME